MIKFQLFIAEEVLEYIPELPRAEQRQVVKTILDLTKAPETLAHGLLTDRVGRTLHLHRVGKYAIEYWVDHADQHIKVMMIRRER